MQEKSLDSEDDLIGTVIGDDEILQDYEPSETEIRGYALQLGMNPDEDQEYLFIAREGLKAPIPKPWAPCRTKKGRIFYYNFDTGESTWEHPSDKFYKEKFEQMKFSQQPEQKSKNLATFKNQLLEISDIMQTSQTREFHILGSKNSVGTLNLSDIQPNNQLSVTKRSFSHHSNILSDRNLELNTQREGECSQGSGKKLVESGFILNKGQQFEFNLSVEKSKENNIEEGFNSNTNVNYEQDKKVDTEGTNGEYIVGEIEKNSIGDFQKYEDDLKLQISYVLSEFERNYKDHAEKIEEQYRKEISRSQSRESEFEGTDIQQELKSFELKVKGENEEDLKNQIDNVNQQYEIKRKEMEERAEKEMQQCLHEVREKYQSEIQNISKVSRHKKAKSVSFPEKVDDFRTEKRLSLLDNKKIVMQIEYQKRYGEIEQQMTKGFEAEILKFKKEIKEKLESEKQDIVRKSEQETKSQTNEWKLNISQEYKNKLEDQKKKVKENQLKIIHELEELASQAEMKKSRFLLQENSLKTEFENKMEALKLEKVLFDQQCNKSREIAAQQVKEKLNMIKGFLENEENELKSRLNSELDSLAKQIAEREVLVNRLENCEKNVNEMESKKGNTEKDIKTTEAEVAELQQKLDQLNASINKIKHKMVEKEQKKKETAKDPEHDKIDDLNKRLYRVEAELSSIKQKSEEFIDKLEKVYPKDTVCRLHSQISLAKLYKGVQEIKEVLTNKNKRSTSAEKPHCSEDRIETSNKTVDYGRYESGDVTILQGRRSSLEPITDMEAKYSQGLRAASPIENKSSQIQYRETVKKGFPKHTGVMSFEWEEEEKQEKKKLNESDKKVKEYPTKDSKSPLKSRNGWRTLIDFERGKLKAYFKLIQNKKLDIKMVQNNLQKEQSQYKDIYLQYKSDTHKSYSKKLQLEMLKKSVNTKIQEYNRALFWIREQESIIISKQDVLNNLEKAYDEFQKDFAPNEENLSYHYKIFKSIQTDPILTEEIENSS